MPVSPEKIAQVAVPVIDLERARAFYRDKLGLTHLFDAPPGLCFFRCGETRLMLSRPGEAETASASLLYYSVASAREAESDLAQGGVEIVEPALAIAEVEGRTIWLAVARDSEGNLFGLMSEESRAQSADGGP